MKRRASLLLLAVVAAATASCAASGPLASDTRVPKNSYSISPKSGPPGTTVTLTGVCDLATTVFHYVFSEIPFVGQRADWIKIEGRTSDLKRGGAFTMSFVVPATARPGSYRLTAGCLMEDRGAGNGFAVIWKVKGEVPTSVPPANDTGPVDFDVRWTPVEGRPGTVIHFEGVCRSRDGAAGAIEVSLIDGAIGDRSRKVAAAANGAWSHDLPVGDFVPNYVPLQVECRVGDLPPVRSAVLWRNLGLEKESGPGLLPYALAVVVLGLIAAPTVWFGVRRRTG